MKVSGETMNKIYDEFKTLTLNQIKSFQALAAVDWARGRIDEAALDLMLYQSNYAISRGWHA